MFSGIKSLTLDAKGRVAVPSRYRAQLQEAGEQELKVTLDFKERCLLVYSLSVWSSIEEQLSLLPGLDGTSQILKRTLIGHAEPAELDSHGRIHLPPLLREITGLEKNVVVVGLGNKFEIWDEARWKLQRQADLEQAQRHDFEVPPQLEELAF